MKIVGCDFHPRWQQIAVFDSDTGETNEGKLMNGDGEAERFYGDLSAPSLVGIEACGNSQWFIELLEGLGHEVWIGDAAQIRASYVRKQKTDRRQDLLELLAELDRQVDELDQSVSAAFRMGSRNPKPLTHALGSFR
ncbi:MAG: hypothetical protein ABSD70_05110 [Terracidiphilus sp.]|jgi:transposase